MLEKACMAVEEAAKGGGVLSSLGWAGQRLRYHAALAAGLRAAHGGLPGRGAADALRDPLMIVAQNLPLTSSSPSMFLLCS